MDSIKPYSRRSFSLILLFMVLLTGALAAMVYVGKTYLSSDMSHLVASETMTAELMGQMTQLHDTYVVYLISSSAGVLILGGILLWLVLRRVAKRGLTHTGRKIPAAAVKKKDDSQPLQNQRLFLHLLTVLQREGRLVDFFQEDLDGYADEQIGAAVRNIHGNCQKILHKRLAMLPIVTDGEGDTIVVQAGFDPDAVKLTGRVTGEPPFTGIVRHKGWRVKKIDLPDLTALSDPTIISPAEVEIE